MSIVQPFSSFFAVSPPRQVSARGISSSISLLATDLGSVFRLTHSSPDFRKCRGAAQVSTKRLSTSLLLSSNSYTQIRSLRFVLLLQAPQSTVDQAAGSFLNSSSRCGFAASSLSLLSSLTSNRHRPTLATTQSIRALLHLSSLVLNRPQNPPRSFLTHVLPRKVLPPSSLPLIPPRRTKHYLHFPLSVPLKLDFRDPNLNHSTPSLLVFSLFMGLHRTARSEIPRILRERYE